MVFKMHKRLIAILCITRETSTTLRNSIELIFYLNSDHIFEHKVLIIDFTHLVSCSIHLKKNFLEFSLRAGKEHPRNLYGLLNSADCDVIAEFVSTLELGCL